MRAEIITIGTEILLGQTVDSNSAWLGQQLNECGVQVERITSISDRPEAIVAALEAVPAHIDWILLTGGLGPTKDDLTKKVLCDYLKDYLIFRPEVYAHIEALFAGMGRVPNALNRPQAELPASAEVIQNTVGTAQGMLWTRGKQRILSMPGVPYEMKRIMEDGILPRMREERNEILLHRYVVVQGIPESDLAMRMEDWESALKPPLSLAYLPSPGLVKLRISVAGPSKQEEVLVQAISEAAASLKQLLGNDAYAEELVPLEKVIGQMLIERGQTLSTAESCTGGGIASRLTSVSGSSAYFQGAIVAYANVVKQAQLSVNPADLLLYGAVSEQVVRQMATGVRKHLKTDWSIATSGIAGPTGGSAEKPIGTVWIAVSGPGYSWARCFQMGKDRSRVIEKSILASLNALRQGLATD
ncbi:MAG: competence/damage-inducible protein A [Schleiferiaceae bacterium]|nr:competence/damage-inducible protein A [Schleiferiaceae bacterium]